MTSAWRRLLPYTRPHRASLAMVLVLMLTGIGLELLRPWPMKLLVDQVFAQRALSSAGSWVPKSLDAMTPVSIVALLAASTVAIFIGIQLATIVRTHLQVGVGARMSYELGADLFTHFQQLSATYHAKTQVGDLTRRVVTDATCARDMIVAVAVPASAAVVRVVAMAVVMWRLDPFLALCALSVTPVTLVLIRKFDATIAQRTYTWQQREGDILAHAEQTFSALPVVQAFGREEEHTSRFLAHARRSLDAMMSATRMQVAFKLSVSAVSAIGTALILMIGGFRTLNGNITAGELLVFISYLAALYAPVETLAYSSAGYAAAVARARRVFEVLDATEVVAERPGARALTRAQGAIALEGVSFGYDAARPVLQDVTLQVAPGEVVALVGATGAGKSTLVGLVPRFFDPWSGRVCIDGQDVRELTVASVRAQVALVLQEPFLLPLTVAENIAYGRPGATMAEIEAAARAANAHEFIARLPAGYATVLAERGASLSGGQQQRLSIARALLKDAPILILDEPTSALDAETEGLLLDALGRLMKGRTTLIIAHRLTTIRTADRIVAMAQGRIVEQGSHDQLLAHDGVYAALYQSQFRHTLSEQPEATA